jgi:glycosyltransferase involved in cell wall biosynthesis
MNNEKIKLIIFPGNFIPHIGGLETHVDEFSKYLYDDGDYEVTIFTPKLEASWKDFEIRHGGVKVIRYPAFELISNWPFPKIWNLNFWKLFFKLYKNKYDVVMTRTRFFSNSLLGLIFAKFRLKKKKLVHVEHGSSFVILESKFKSFLAKVYDMIFGNLIFLFSDEIVAVSEIVKKFICSNFLNCKKKIHIIYRGVDFNFYKNIKKDYNLKKKFKEKIIIVFLGRLYKWKGVENSIKAIKLLPENLKKKIVFLIIGDGEDYIRLKKLSGNELEKTIFFLGRVDFKKAVSILKSSDIYLHSAYIGGGLSNSLLQAMYCENLIIASPNEGASEIIKNKQNGLLLKNNSITEIKKNLENVLNNFEENLKYKKGIKRYIKNKFRWEEVVYKYKSILK